MNSNQYPAVDKKGVPIVYFGFWNSPSEPELPVVRASIYDNTEIVASLLNLQMICEKGKNDAASHERYRGFSICRCCGHANGSGEYRMETFEKVYVWPSGLIHYLEEHNIEPPEELRELTEIFEVKWKLLRENPKMNIFPFNTASNEDEIIEIWNRHRPRGLMWNSVHAQIRSDTELRLIAQQAGVVEPVFDIVLTVPPEDLANLVKEQKYSMAEEEYEERKQASREREIRLIVKEMFGD